MSVFEEYERKWEEELNKLPKKVETVEQALDAIERIALNGYKQIKTAEDVSMENIDGVYAKINIMRERFINIVYLARLARRILQQERKV